MSSRDILTLRPNGTLVSGKYTGDDDSRVKMAARVQMATTPVFPAHPVGVGDTWSQEYRASAASGTHATRADFEVVGFETLGPVETVKIKMRFRETDAAPALSCNGFFWIEKASGDAMVSDYTVENVPMPVDVGVQGLMSVKVREERAGGGPLPGSAAPDTTRIGSGDAGAG